MWKEVNLISTNFSAKHTPSATLIKLNIQIHMKTGSCFCVRNTVYSKTFLKKIYLMPLQNDYLREDKKQKKHLSIDQTILNPMEIFFSV